MKEFLCRFAVSQVGMLLLTFLSISLSQSTASANPGLSCEPDENESWAQFLRGQELFVREWSLEDGFRSFENRTPQFSITNSCAMCHNVPFFSTGAGGNVPDDYGVGRNVPHLFGVGVIEGIASRVRKEILAKYDVNKIGYIPKEQLNGEEVFVDAVAGTRVSFGTLSINRNGDVDLDPSIITWLVAANGTPLFPLDEDGRKLTFSSKEVAGFDLAHAPFGWSTSDHQYPSIRLFTLGVWRTLFGLGIDDRTTTTLVHGLWARNSRTGREQLFAPFITGATTKQRSETELDDLEYFLLNAPEPSETDPTPQAVRGRLLFSSMGCASCHTPNWRLPVTSDLRTMQWTVKIDGSSRVRDVMVDVQPPSEHLVEGIYSDFRYHDVGSKFGEYYRHDGQLRRRTLFRTPPLWGIASSAPYGHDGMSFDLDSVIRRHGGEATASAMLYTESTSADRSNLGSFLNSLTLFPLSEAIDAYCRRKAVFGHK